jgi:general secretion pathway protein F
MPAFEYRALDAAGRSHKGVTTGDSPRQVRAELRQRGLHPIRVDTLAETAGRRAHPAKRRIAVAALAALTRQLATLLRAGIPLEQALRTMQRQVDAPPVREVLAGVHARVTEGIALQRALADYPAAFSDVYRAMVEAGEAGGCLEDVLEHLAEHIERQHALRQKVATALIYPAVMVVVAVAVVLVLLTYVVPEIVRVFEHTGQTLPVLTRALIAVSHLFRDFGLVLLLGGAGGIALLRWLWRQPRSRAVWDEQVLRLPLARRCIGLIDGARLARTLAILTQSGIPLLDALAIAGRTLGNGTLRGAVRRGADAVREGGRLHTALAATGHFSPLLLQLLAAGEDSGELERMLEHLAAQQERELSAWITAFAALLEPLIILLMGGVVLLIVLAVLLPIFEMNQLVGV